MAEFSSTARVVIIGGGAVGTSALYHLGLAGWTDCVLLEKNELTAGSTWHAAGNIPTFSADWAVMNMQRYSTELFRRIGDEVDYPINYHVTGSVRLAHTDDRMMEFEHACGMGRRQGMDLEMMSLGDFKDAYPFMEVHDLKGGLWDPMDGDIDPAQVTQAFAKGARDLGQKIHRFTPATGVSRKGSEWVVHTEKGDISCDIVVNAAGYYARRVGEWFRPFGGRQVPMVVMSHQYILTEEIDEIAQWSAAEARKLPLLRDVDTSWYLRQENTGLNLGPYERNCRAHWVDDDDPIPDDFSFQLFPDDLDRLDDYVADAMERVPVLGRTGITKIINGPIPYTPDGNPLIGPMPGVPNAFEACVFTFGIAQSGGAGKILAEWITEGRTEWDCWSLDPRRFTGHADADYCVQKGLEVYGHEYAIHYPHYEWPAGRDKKRSALHERLLAAGGQMGPYNGWERANWFAAAGDDISQAAAQTWARSGPWERAVRAECEAVRDNCGVLAISGFSRFDVEGEGARAFIDGLTASRLPAVGRIGLAYFADADGRTITEMSVTVLSDEHVRLITAAPAQWHDCDLLVGAAPEGISITDRTDAFDCLLVTGPHARDVLHRLTDADLSKPWLTVQDAIVAGKACTVVRVSFAGELGWEVHCAAGDTGDIWDAVTAAGAVPFGMYALNALRLEKGYRAWKGDLSTDYTLLESGLDRFVRLDKPQDFPGKAALAREAKAGPERRFATLIVDSPDTDAPTMTNIWRGDAIVGEVTSGGYGYRVNASIALAILGAEHAEPGTALEVEIFGTRHPAIVQPDAPLWDPENRRLRA